MTPARKVLVTRCTGGAFTRKDKVWLAEVCVASVTCRVAEGLLTRVGVPEIVTELLVLELSDKPAGRLPEVSAQVNGLVPPAAVMVAE